MHQQKIRKIAEEIVKFSASQDHLLTLIFDENTLRNLEKTFGSVEGFGEIKSQKIPIQISITYNPDVTDVVKFETDLQDILKRKTLSNVKLIVARSVGRPLRVLKRNV